MPLLPFGNISVFSVYLWEYLTCFKGGDIFFGGGGYLLGHLHEFWESMFGMSNMRVNKSWFGKLSFDREQEELKGL